jgi:hypothetical protein
MLTSMVSVGCVHLDKENRAGLDILRQYLAANPCDIFLSGGDLSDAGMFRASARNGEGGKISNVEIKRAIEKDFNLTRKFITSLTGLTDHIYLIRGNHEFRYERAASTNELFKNELSYETYCKEWAPEAEHVKDYDLGQELHIGRAKFIHGRYYGRNHLRQTYERYGENTYYWHTHEVSGQSFSKNTLTNAPQVATLGCMEKITPDWMQGAPHNWTNCFQQWYFQPNGEYQMYNIIVNGNTAILPDGTILKGKNN